MNNTKVATVNIKIKELFFKWVEITRPFHGLTPRQQKVLALLLYYHFKYKQEITNTKIVWNTLFDYDTKILIKEELKMTDGGFMNILYLLRQKKIITHNTINPMFIPDITPETKNFKVIFNFNIINA